MDRSSELPPDYDLGALGKTMLEAAEGAGIGVTVTFIDGGSPRNVFVSQAAADMLGWSVDEMVTRD
ncbi:MAG: hypothetical protein ACRENE_08450, partial [Polyangiaceae bacterium]